MAGHRQHHIPRFLQKGFCSKSIKNQWYAYVFSKGKKPYETNLINIGLEIDFYGNPNESQADEKITKEEGLHFDFVESLRKTTKKQLVDSYKTSRFIAHMIIRAKHLRASSNEIGTVFVDTLHKNLKKENDSEKAFKAILKNNRRIVAQKIQEKLPSSFNKDQKFLLTKNLLDNPEKFAQEVGSEFIDNFVSSLSMLSAEIPKFSKNSHVQVLEDETVSNSFLEVTKDFIWKIFHYESDVLILGDVGVIGRFFPNGNYKSLLFFKENLQDVFLPISKSHLLVGSSSLETIQMPTVIEINKEISKLSRNIFISSTNNLQTQKLTDCLGDSSSPIQDEDIDQLEKRIKKDLFGK